MNTSSIFDLTKCIIWLKVSVLLVLLNLNSYLKKGPL